MANLVITCLAAVVATDGAELQPAPFFRLQWRAEVHSALLDRRRVGRDRIRSATSENGKSTDWRTVAPPSGPVPITSDGSVGTLRGILLFHDNSDIARPLPKNIPFPLFGHPTRSLRAEIPHRVIRFHVLEDDESFTEWVSKYTKFCASELRKNCRSEVDEGKRTARMVVRGSVARPMQQQSKASPDSSTNADSHVLFLGKDQTTREVTGFFRLIGRTVYRAETKALLHVPSESLPDFSRQAEEDSWVCSVHPGGLPQTLRRDFLSRVTKYAFPGLQRRDDEPEDEHRHRVAHARWQIDALRTLLHDVSQIRLVVRGLASTENKPIEFDMAIHSPAGRLGTLIGQPRKTRSSSYSIEGSEALSVVYGGTLPGTLQTALQGLAKIDQTYSSLARLFADRLDVGLFLSIVDSKPIVWGRVKTAGANEIVNAIAGDAVPQGTPHVIAGENDSPSPRPREVGFLSTSSEMWFAAANRGVSQRLREVKTETAEPNKQLLAIRCDAAQLSALQTSPDFDGLPRRIMDSIEAAWFQLCWHAHNSGGPSSKRSLLARMERYENAVAKRLSSLAPEIINKMPASAFESEEYEQMMLDYSFITDVKFDPKRDSFRHWFAPGKSELEVAIQYDAKGITIAAAWASRCLPLVRRISLR